MVASSPFGTGVYPLSILILFGDLVATSPFQLECLPLLLSVLPTCTDLTYSVLTAPTPAKFWDIPFGFALGILIMDETRKLIVRIYPKVCIVGPGPFVIDISLIYVVLL